MRISHTTSNLSDMMACIAQSNKKLLISIFDQNIWGIAFKQHAHGKDGRLGDL